MYVAFAYWRVHDRKPEPARVPETVWVPVAPFAEAPAVATGQGATSKRAIEEPLSAHSEMAAEEEELAAPGTIAEPLATPRLGANDNRVARGVPDSDVQRFYRERVVAAAEGVSLTSTELYEEYCRWCEDNEKVPFAHPRVTREIGELGVKKERIGKRTRYFGIALRSEARREEDKKLPAALPRAA